MVQLPKTELERFMSSSTHKGNHKWDQESSSESFSQKDLILSVRRKPGPNRGISDLNQLFTGSYQVQLGTWFQVWVLKGSSSKTNKNKTQFQFGFS